MLSLAFIAQSYLKEHGTARFSTSGYFNSLCFHQNKDILSCFLLIFLQLLKIDINIHTVGAVTEPELEKKKHELWFIFIYRCFNAMDICNCLGYPWEGLSCFIDVGYFKNN